MQLSILAPMEGGECPPVPSIESSARVYPLTHELRTYPRRVILCFGSLLAIVESSLRPMHPLLQGDSQLSSQECVASQVNMIGTTKQASAPNKNVNIIDLQSNCQSRHMLAKREQMKHCLQSGEHFACSRYAKCVTDVCMAPGKLSR